MRKLFYLLPAILLFSSCDFVTGERIRGNGNVVTLDRQVGAFSGVRSSGSFDIYISEGATSTLRIEAEENLQEYIETDLDGDVLKISTRDGVNIRPKRDLKIYITAPSYSMVRLSGSGNIESQTRIKSNRKIELGISGSGDINVELDAPDVMAEISGSGTINLKGQTQKLHTEINGGGDIHAFDLKSEDARVEISGSGDAEIFASQNLAIEVRGSGDVKYKGGANVKSDIRGSGNVVKVDN